MAAKRLLIVDDEPRFAAFAERVASRRLGFAAEVTVHGSDYQAAYRRQTPDIIVIITDTVNARLLAKMKGFRGACRE